MVITNNKKFTVSLKLKAFGIDKDIKDRKNKDYMTLSLGFNYRMTDFQAALGLIK